MCPEWKPNRLHPGGLAEFFRAEAATVATDTLLIPDNVPFDDAALVEPVACALKAVDRAAGEAGDTAAVVGLGSSGVLLGLLAREAGAVRLVGSDPTRRGGKGLRLARPRPRPGRGACGRRQRGVLGARRRRRLRPPVRRVGLRGGDGRGGAGRTARLLLAVPPETRWSLAPHTAYLRV